MTKTFFVVVPFTPVTLKSDTGFLSKIIPVKKETQAAAELDFEEKRSQLEQRVAVVQEGLARTGIKSAPLGTEEVVEVFYKVFNPGELEGKIQI